MIKESTEHSIRSQFWQAISDKSEHNVRYKVGKDVEYIVYNNVWNSIRFLVKQKFENFV